MEKRIEHINKITQTIAKHPISFVAAVFFCMFWMTYYINIRKNDENEETWKELYKEERKARQELVLSLLTKANVLAKDSILKDNTKKQSEIILNTKNNEK